MSRLFQRRLTGVSTSQYPSGLATGFYQVSYLNNNDRHTV